MRTLRSLVLVSLLATGGCQVLGEFVFAVIDAGVEAGIEAGVHEIDHHPPPPRPHHRSPRVLDRTRLR